MKITKEAEEFTIRHEDLAIRMVVNFPSKTVDITTAMGKTFCFLGSSPELVEKIGDMIQAGGAFARGALIDRDNPQGI